MKAGLILSIFCLLSLSSTAYASDSQKINTIKEMYESSLLYDSEREMDFSDPEVLYNYADNSLAQALVLQDKVMEEEGMICGDFPGTVMWDTNDPDFRTKINYSVIRDGKIKVNFGYGGSTLYSLKCSDKSCKITDMYINTSPPSSLKTLINKECR